MARRLPASCALFVLLYLPFRLPFFIHREFLRYLLFSGEGLVNIKMLSLIGALE